VRDAVNDRQDLVSFTVLVNGARIPDRYVLSQLRIHKEINRIPTARLTLDDGDVADATFAISESASFVPGAEIEIQAGYHGIEKTLFKGVVVRHAIKARRRGSSQLLITCHDKAMALTHGRRSAYLGKSDSTVFRQLISDAGLAATVTATAAQHDPIIHFYGTDWDFLVSRAELHGHVVIVNDGRVTVGPPQVDAAPDLEVAYGGTLSEIDAELDAASQPTQVHCRAWDYTGQALASASANEPAVNAQGNLSGAQMAQALGLPARTLQSCAPLTVEELTQWANAQLLKSRLARLRGTVSFNGDAAALPGRTIKLAGLGARFNGTAYLSSVTHVLEDGDWVTHAGFGMDSRWFGETHADMAPPAASGRSGGVPGLQIAKVTQIDQDPDGQTRVLVGLPAMGLDGDGVWCRLASGYATANGGIFFVPEIGDEVVLGFLNDDPAYPVVLGSLYSGQRTPPYAADAPNTNKAIVTKAQLKISMDDVAKVLKIETPGGHVVTLSDQDKSMTLLDSNGNRLHFEGAGVTLESVADLTIKATGQVRITAGADLTMEGVNVSCTASAELKASGQAGIDVSSQAVVKIAGSMVAIN
jgi:Rhs element Vgr protein